MASASDFLGLLDQVGLDAFIDQPRPGWAGPATLFGSPLVSLAGLPGSSYLAAGVPFDGTASSRPGAAMGAHAIRSASLVFSSYVESLGSHEMLDMRTGESFWYAPAALADAGDLHIFPTDTVRTFQALATEVHALASSDAVILLMGGDHSISFPTFAGWMRAMRARVPESRLGYIQIDHHFDFGHHSAIHGPLYHGSNARRISEIPGMEPRRMAFIGMGSTTRKAQYDGLRADRYHIVSAADIKRRGPDAALAEVIDAFSQSCDAVYLSIDIDVLDCSVAPGTGNVTIGGLLGGELLDVTDRLRLLPIRALDVVEVAPAYDPTGRTAQIAARLLFEFSYRQSR